jgi:hypothetical protein
MPKDYNQCRKHDWAVLKHFALWHAGIYEDKREDGLKSLIYIYMMICRKPSTTRSRMSAILLRSASIKWKLVETVSNTRVSVWGSTIWNTRTSIIDITVSCGCISIQYPHHSTERKRSEYRAKNKKYNCVTFPHACIQHASFSFKVQNVSFKCSVRSIHFSTQCLRLQYWDFTSM